MNTLRYVGLTLALALFAFAGCKKGPLSPAPTAPALGAELVPVVPPQLVPGGLPVTGSVRSAEGVAGTIQPTGTPVTAATPLGAGNIVQVMWNGSTYQGQILALNADGTVRIHYVGWSNGWDENATRERLKVGPIVGIGGGAPPPQAAQPPPAAAAAAAPAGAAPPGTAITATTPLTVNQAIVVEWNGRWYPSTVVAVNGDGTVRIHYVGWADSFDENAARTRIHTP